MLDAATQGLMHARGGVQAPAAAAAAWREALPLAPHPSRIGAPHASPSAATRARCATTTTSAAAAASAAAVMDAAPPQKAPAAAQRARSSTRRRSGAAGGASGIAMAAGAGHAHGQHAGRTLLVVESPAKAVKIQKFLGDEYEVCVSVCGLGGGGHSVGTYDNTVRNGGLRHERMCSALL